MLVQRIPWPLSNLYEKATRQVIEGYYRQVADEVADFLQKGRILDLGTGPGYLPVEIAKKRLDIQIVALDLSRSLIRMAREKARKAHVSEQIRFEVGNAGALRFEDESFDMAISTGMLHMVRDPVLVLRECHRVLKKGGQAWIYDPAQVCTQIDIEKWKTSLTCWEKIVYRVFKFYTQVKPARRYSREEVLHMVDRTPFEILSLEQENDEIKARLLSNP